MDSRSLYKLFSKFGVVKDVFIPNKRRKSTNTRFGFIRYDCSIFARIAEQKANGLWVDDKSMLVKAAEYGNRIDERRKLASKLASQPEPRKPFAMSVNRNWNQGIDGRTFADVIKSTDSRCPPKTTIRVEEIGNGWLFESLIMKLKTEYSVQEVNTELKRRGMSSVLVREGGGRDEIISFHSREDLLKGKLKLKFGFMIGASTLLSGVLKIGSLWREVVILNKDICSPKSFRYGRFKIVTSVMDPISTSLNLECKGRIYPIRVYEELNSENALFSFKETTTIGAEEDGCSKVNHLPIAGTNLKVEGDNIVHDVARDYEVSNASMACRLKNNVDLEVGGSWSHASAVEETKALGGNSNEDNACVESSFPVVSLRQKHWLNHVNYIDLGSLGQPTRAAHSCVQPIESKDYVSNSSSERLGYGNFEVDPHSKTNNFSFSPLFSISINTHIKKGKRKGNKNALLIGRFPGLARRFGQKGSGTSKGSMARSRAATSSQSQHQSAGRIQETYASLQLGNELGIGYKGHEVEAINSVAINTNRNS
ncbi:hypothetical protein ACSBR1_012585 [Camellia fascicularis]